MPISIEGFVDNRIYMASLKARGKTNNDFDSAVNTCSLEYPHSSCM